MIRTGIPGFIGDAAADSTTVFALTLAWQLSVINCKIQEEERRSCDRRLHQVGFLEDSYSPWDGVLNE